VIFFFSLKKNPSRAVQEPVLAGKRWDEGVIKALE